MFLLAVLLLTTLRLISNGVLCLCRRLIHPSAWKGNSPNFGSRILHSSSPTPLESPSRHPASPRIPRCRSVPVTMDGYSWERRDRGRRRDHRGGPVSPVPVGGGLCKSG